MCNDIEVVVRLNDSAKYDMGEIQGKVDLELEVAIILGHAPKYLAIHLKLKATHLHPAIRPPIVSRIPAATR
jgi:hypothetical protein